MSRIQTLFKYRQRSKRTENWWASKLPSGLKAGDQDQIAEEFRRGDFKNKNKFIEAYIRLAISIGSKFKCKDDKYGQDSVGVALLSLCEVPEMVKTGQLNTLIFTLSNVTSYYISGRCLIHKRTDHLVPIPNSTMHKHGMVPLEQVTHTVVHFFSGEENEWVGGAIPVLENLVEPYHYSEEIPEEYLKFAKTTGQVKVLQMLWLGHTNVEIAKAMCLSEGWVRKQLLIMRELAQKE